MTAREFTDWIGEWPWWVVLAAFAAGLIVGRRSGRGHDEHAHDAPGTPAAEEQQPQTWTCSMHPQIRRDGPGQCPICGMDLIPLEPTKSDRNDPTRVVLSERAKILARVRTTEASRLGFFVALCAL